LPNEVLVPTGRIKFSPAVPVTVPVSQVKFAGTVRFDALLIVPSVNASVIAAGMTIGASTAHCEVETKSIVPNPEIVPPELELS